MTENRLQDAATQTVRRLDRVIRELLGPAEIFERSPLSVVGRPVGGEPISFTEATRGSFDPIRPGDQWGRAWDTVWMQVRGKVPASWERGSGATVELEIDLGFNEAQAGFQAEGLVYTADGRVVRALSPRNHRVPLDVSAGGDVEYWVEAAANPTLNSASGTDLIPLAGLGTWDTAGDELIYRFAGAWVSLRDPRVTALLRDVEVLRGIAVAETTMRRRRELILAALEEMLETIDPNDVRGTASAARETIAPALATPANASSMDLIAVGHAHIDSAWLWPLRETIRKCARTFSNVVSLMEENPDFVFACSSAQQFKWMKEYYPELFDRIRDRVAAGQFVPVGGMWVESDTNMPSGESLARQFIAGQLFFEEEFGFTCSEVWLPDSFGYTGSFPQIARAAGGEWFFGQKMSWNRTNRMPHHTFDWEGIDGTRILTHFTPVDTYNSDLSPAELLYAAENFEDHASSSAGIVPFGYGDGGGGPTQEMLDVGSRSADIEGLPHVQFGAPRDFFERVSAEAVRRPVWTGEMYLELHRGTYTSQSRTKRGNRRAESLLRQAELWSATAAVRVGHPYPQIALKRLWEQTLLLQFHDILPGSSISWVHADAERMHADNEVELRDIIRDALAALAETGEATLVANGSPFGRAGIAPLSLGTPGSSDTGLAMTTDGDDHILRNRFVELRVSRDGTFTDLLELAGGRSLFSRGLPGNAIHLHQDIPTDWDAWDIDEHYRRLSIDVPPAESVTALPGDAGVRIVRRFGDSTVTQDVSLVRDSAAVQIVTNVDWHERQRLLKLAFPFRIDARNSSAETQFGHVTRPTHENTSWDEARFEVVAHRWLHVTDGSFGAAVVNDSTYGHDVTRIAGAADEPERYITQVRQTLLRGPLYPDPESDQGMHTFTSRIVLGPDVASAVESAYDLDTPPLEVTGGATEIEPIVVAAGDGVVLHTVKLAEDGSGDVIARVYESNGTPTRARISIDSSSIWAVDLLEKPTAKSLASAEGGVEFDLRGFEFVTVRAKR